MATKKFRYTLQFDMDHDLTTGQFGDTVEEALEIERENFVDDTESYLDGLPASAFSVELVED